MRRNISETLLAFLVVAAFAASVLWAALFFLVLANCEESMGCNPANVNWWQVSFFALAPLGVVVGVVAFVAIIRAQTHTGYKPSQGRPSLGVIGRIIRFAFDGRQRRA